MTHVASELAEVIERLDRIESVLGVLVDREAVQDWYDTATVASVLDRSHYQVREWCRDGRVNAEKRACGRGRAREWMISHEELLRIKSYGLLPAKNGKDR